MRKTLLPIMRASSLALLAMMASCASFNTGSHHDPTTNFASYESFGWIGEDPYIVGDRSALVSPLAVEQIKTAIRTELERKGYAYMEDGANADFVVSFTVGTRDEIRIDSYPAGYRGAWGWHVPYSYYYYHDVSAHSYTRGTLGIDIFDNESGKPVWHGWAEKTVTDSDRRDPSESIEEGVRLIFAEFPD